MPGHSKRTISKELSVSRKTVTKFINEYKASLTSADPEGSLEAVLTMTPRYYSSSRQRRVITGPLQKLIDDCLEKNVRKRAMGLRKQCMRGRTFTSWLSNRDFR